MIGVIDYGAGNLFSLGNALDFLKIPYFLVKKEADLAQADGVILPGVGAYSDAMDKLKQAHLVEPLKAFAKSKPFLGICLGLQLLFEYGEEGIRTEGLGLLPGHVRRFEDHGLVLPHIGWNTAQIQKNHPFIDGVADESYFYYVHSYRVVCAQDNIVLATTYGETFPGAVAQGHIFGAQFHPEKSGEPGLQILRNFGRMVDSGYIACD